MNDALAASLVHCEGSTFPVAGSTEATELFQDNSAVFVSPVPSVFEEFLASKVSLFDTLLSEFVNNLSFSSDRSVVGTWNPAGVFALHTSATDEDVLYGVVHHVTHVEHACHVRRRYHYRIRFTFIWCRMKIILV